MNLNWIPPALNTLGLILDITGVIGIYNLKIKGMNKVFQYPIIRNQNNNSVLKSDFEDLIKDLNRKIEEVNKQNAQTEKETFPYFLLIFFGFCIQVIVIWVSFFMPH